MLKTILKRAFTVTILMLALVIAIRTGSPKLRAQEPQHLAVCTAATLHGGYGSATKGLINSSSNSNDVTLPTFMPFAEAAYFDFDGNGHFSAVSTAVLGGQVNPPAPATGSYTVDSSTCTGTLTINIPDGPSFHRSLVIVDDAREIEFVSTDAGFVIAGSLKKQL